MMNESMKEKCKNEKRKKERNGRNKK